MARLIDADELLKHKTDHEMISTHLIYNAPTVEFNTESWKLTTNQEQTIEVKPVKHGTWAWSKGYGEYHCPFCGRFMQGHYEVEVDDGKEIGYDIVMPRYCGWCGAKLEVEDGNKDSL